MTIRKYLFIGIFLTFFESKSQEITQNTTFSIGSLYRTSIEMNVYCDDGDGDLSDDVKRTANAGLKYRYLGESSDKVYITFVQIITEDDKIRANNSYVNKKNYSCKYYVYKSEFVEANHLKTLGINTGNLLAPVKVRPSVSYNETVLPWELSTDITLGQYVGLRMPLSKYRPYYLNATVTLGPSLLSINGDNSTDISEEASTLLGLTVSGGIILEIRNLQLGYIFGADYAPGAAGKDWVYNKKVWHSLGVGINFTNNGRDL